MRELQEYHLAWLSIHTERTEEWLREKLADGFHIHHLDGSHDNNKPQNLVLMDGKDHLALHGMDMRSGTQKNFKFARRVLKRGRPRKRPREGWDRDIPEDERKILKKYMQL